jgi:hypothetical protein
MLELGKVIAIELPDENSTNDPDRMVKGDITLFEN